MKHLKEEYPDACFVPEAATNVMESEREKQKEAEAVGLEYEPIMPMTNYPAFRPLVLREAVKLEADISEDANLVFMDRSFIDQVGYNQVNGFDSANAELEQKIKLANYAFVLFCEPVGKYKQTPDRQETPEEARVRHDALSVVHDMSDVQIVHLPAQPVPERLAIIREVIAAH